MLPLAHYLSGTTPQLPIPRPDRLNCFLYMGFTLWHRKLRRPAITCLCLYACSLFFALPGILRNVGRPAERWGKNSVAQGATHFAIADFDGDLRPDMATIHVTRGSSQVSEYSVELQLSSGLRPAIGILGPAGGLQITPQDVNGDKIADLVVTSPFDAHFVAIFLNDGKGNFKRVESLDYPGAGKRPGSRLSLQEDSATFQPAVGQNRGSEGDNFVPACRESINQDCRERPGMGKLRARIFAVLTTAGRAPPLVGIFKVFP